MKRYQLYIFDLDGTLYRGDEALPGAVETVQALQANGSTVRFLTNNSGRSGEYIAAKLQRLGFAAQAQEVYTSAVGAARVCRQRSISRAFVVGEEGLTYELLQEGVTSVQYEPQAVVVGICRNFTYQWMNEAMQHLLAGAKFLATNTDASYPLEGGKLEPGAGAIVASIQTCSGVEPEVIGKPQPLLLEMILADTRVGASDTLVIGDRYETDIEAGIAAGCDVFQVLTGVSRYAAAGVPSGSDLRPLLDE